MLSGVRRSACGSSLGPSAFRRTAASASESPPAIGGGPAATLFDISLQAGFVAPMTVRGEGSSLRLRVAAKPTWRNIPYVLPKVILHFISFDTDIGVGPRQ